MPANTARYLWTPAVSTWLGGLTAISCYGWTESQRRPCHSRNGVASAARSRLDGDSRQVNGEVQLITSPRVLCGT